MRLEKVKTVFELSRNDIKARYSNSLLGIIWAFAMPLITILLQMMVQRQTWILVIMRDLLMKALIKIPT